MATIIFSGKIQQPPMLTVGIDITSALYGRGVSRYTLNLVRAMLRRKKNKYTLYGSSLRGHSQLTQIAEELKKSTGTKAGVVIQAYPPSLYNFLWNNLAFPKLKSALPDIDVFHSWDWVQPPDKDLPLVSTVHDLAMVKFPEIAHPKLKRMHERSWKVLRERGAHLIAVSRATRNDIIELLEYPADKVHVIYEALPEEVVAIGKQLNEDIAQKTMTRLGLVKPYVLAVGTREPRKNLERLIEAWKPLKADVDLVIAGEAGWDATSTGTKLSEIPELKLLGKVDDITLAVLYTNAEVFAYPSLYEGFGLPILEAFYFGTSVLTSNLSSMAEIAGNAALLVDPLSVDEIGAGLQTLLSESESEKNTRRQKMVIRQHMFSWNQAAEQTEAVYSTAVQDFHESRGKK